MKRGLLYTVAAASLAACSKSAAPAPAPAAPAPAPAPAPSAPAPTTPAPAPAAAPTSTPAPAPSAAPAATPSSAPSQAAPAAAPTQAPNPAPTTANSDTPSTRPISAHPLGNDLRQLEIAVRLRDEFEPKPNGTQFEFKVTMTDGSHPIDEIFKLTKTDGVTCPRLQAEARPGTHITTFKLNPEDHQRMQNAVATLAKLKETSTGGNDLSFQATVETQMKPGVETPDTFCLTIFARTHASVEFAALGDEKIIRPTDPEAGALFT